jgi:hypothetical protein
MDKQAFDLMMKRFDHIDKNMGDIKSTMVSQDGRILSLENTRTNQRGVMIGGGAVVAFFSGIVVWVVNHLWGSQ